MEGTVDISPFLIKYNSVLQFLTICFCFFITGSKVNVEINKMSFDNGIIALHNVERLYMYIRGEINSVRSNGKYYM